jgi:hypothetical protein
MLTYLFFKMSRKNKLIFGGAVIFIILGVLTYASKDSASVRLGSGLFAFFPRMVADGNAPNGMTGSQNLAVTINNGDTQTSSPQVILNLSGQSDTAIIEISEDPAFAQKRQIPYDTNFKINNTPYQFSSVPGLKTIYVKFCTAANACSDKFADSIDYNPSAATSSIYDTNGDNRVDFYELNQLVANWGQHSTVNPYDYDDNGVVDIFDFNQLMVHWTL